MARLILFAEVTYIWLTRLYGHTILPNHCNLIYYRKCMIRFERLTSDNSSFFDKGMGFYAMSFPLHEQRMEESFYK